MSGRTAGQAVYLNITITTAIHTKYWGYSVELPRCSWAVSKVKFWILQQGMWSCFQQEPAIKNWMPAVILKLSELIREVSLITSRPVNPESALMCWKISKTRRCRKWIPFSATADPLMKTGHETHKSPLPDFSGKGLLHVKGV